MPSESIDPDPRRPCVRLTAGEARYLLAIHDLAVESSRPTLAALGRTLRVSPPTALEMVRRLRELGLVDPDSLTLTPTATSAVLVLLSRRNAARTLAHDVLGLDDEQAAIEGERLASTISPELGRRLVSWYTANHTRRAVGGEPPA
jgi:Mn-dependent DtxR family transcriptional regulator